MTTCNEEDFIWDAGIRNKHDQTLLFVSENLGNKFKVNGSLPPRCMNEKFEPERLSPVSTQTVASLGYLKEVLEKHEGEVGKTKILGEIRAKILELENKNISQPGITGEQILENKNSAFKKRESFLDKHKQDLRAQGYLEPNKYDDVSDPFGDERNIDDRLKKEASAGGNTKCGTKRTRKKLGKTRSCKRKHKTNKRKHKTIKRRRHYKYLVV